MKILLIDDEWESRLSTLFKGVDMSRHNIKIADCAEKAISIMSGHGDFDLYMLDHDYSWENILDKDITIDEAFLAQLKEQNSGSYIARYIAENKIGLSATYVLHSGNHHGRANMASILKNGPDSKRLIIDFSIFEMSKHKAPLLMVPRVFYD